MKAAPALLAAALLLAEPAAAGQRVGTIVATTREATIEGGLHGTMVVPVNPSTGAAVLILNGSGPTDRNGNQVESGVRPDTARMIARELSARGIASLRIDKRCVGASRAACPGEENLRLQSFVDDTVLWADYLRAQPGVRCVVILGHSEGALIGALAAARTPVCGLVSLAGPGRPLDEILPLQLKAAGAEPPLLAEVAAIQAELREGRTVGKVPDILTVLYRPSVQPYLISQFGVKPTEALAAVKAPVLLVQGERDLQVGVEDAQLLAAARPDAKLVLVPGANHMLKPAPEGRRENLMTYADPNLALAREVVPAVADFIAALN